MEQHEHEQQPVHEETTHEQPVTSQESPTVRTQRSPWILFGVGIAAGVVICGAVLFTTVFRGTEPGSDSKVAGFFTNLGNTFKGSVASINGSSVSYAKYVSDLATLKKFVENTPEAGFNFSDEELSDQVLSRLLINELMKQMAEDLGVSTSKEDIEKARQDFLSQFETEEAAAKELQERYGWTLEDFMNNVVKPAVLEGKVSEAFASSTNPEFEKYGGVQQVRARHILFKVDDPEKEAAVKKQAESVLQQIKDGADFAEMAKKHGSDGTKDTGGDLGFFGRGAMVPEFELAAFALDAGELSQELVKTQFGYHIIKTEEVQRGLNFQQYLIDRVKSSNIKIDKGVHNPFEELMNQPSVSDEPVVEVAPEETAPVEENS